MSTRAQRFSGRTAEEAVLNAIEALGEDAEVVDAQRVKRPGLAGLIGGEIVVITARPRSGASRRAGAEPPAGRRPKGRGQAKAGAATADAGGRRFRRSLRAAIDDQGPIDPADDWAAEWADDALPPEGHGRDQAVLDLTARDLDLRDAPVDLREPPRPGGGSRLPARFSAADLAPLPEPPSGQSAVPARRVVDHGRPAARPGRSTLPAQPGPLSLAPAPPVPAGLAVAVNPVAADSLAASPAVIDLRSHAQQRARATSLVPPPPPPPPLAPVVEPARSVVELVGRREDEAPRWGRAELRSIGVPEQVLDYLPADDPISDTVWTMALETAIWWTLRKHRPKANLVVDGYGPEGAMALLQAVLAGHVIRSLHLGDRSVDATPHELAKAVRSCLPR